MESHDVLKRVIETIGTKQVASDLKVSTSLVYKWCAEPGEDASGARNPLDRLIQLHDSTSDRRPIEWLCTQAGGFFVQSVETEPETIDEAYVSHTQRLLAEFSELLRTVAESMAHEGRIDAGESKQIRAKWQSLQSCAESFVKACERGSFDPAAR
jgi:hypothetical protein